MNHEEEQTSQALTFMRVLGINDGDDLLIGMDIIGQSSFSSSYDPASGLTTFSFSFEDQLRGRKPSYFVSVP